MLKPIFESKLFLKTHEKINKVRGFLIITQSKLLY